MSERTCHYCGDGPEKDEMRPYGPGGSWIHFDCMIASPEREEAATVIFGLLCDAAGPVVVIGTEDGPAPFNPEKL